MHFTALPESTHALVTLRPIAPADIPVWYAYLSQPTVFEHTSWNLQSPEQLAHYAAPLQPRTDATQLRLAIALRSNNQLVGTIGFHTVSAENRSAELAYDLAPNVWGQGVASHAARVLTDWGHAQAGLVRVQATVLTSNAQSVRVLERCGYAREGLLHSYRLVRGRPGDFWMYAHVAAAGAAASPANAEAAGT